MNGRDLHNAVFGTDEKYISEAENTAAVTHEFRKNRNKKIKAAVAAAFCFAAAISSIMIFGGTDAKPGLSENKLQEDLPLYTASGTTQTDIAVQPPTEPTPNTTVQNEVGSEPITTLPAEGTTAAAELYQVPKWDERSETERFTTLDYNGAKYFISRRETEQQYFGETLGTAYVSGYDMYADREYREEVTVFSVPDILPSCAVGVRFADGVCIAYVNADHTPATLGQFINELGLKKYLTFGKTYSYYFDSEKKYHSVEFDNIDSDTVWDMLLSDTEAENNAEYAGFSTALADISVSIPVLGIENLGMWVTEDGYLCTNILDTGKYFFIGAQKTKAFADYLYNNVMYTDTTLPDITESYDGTPEAAVVTATSEAYIPE